MSIRWAAIAAIFFLGSGRAPGQEPSELFSKLDKNSDGYVAADEVPEEQKELYERLVRRGDDDGDKKLSKEEFQIAMRPDGAGGRASGTGGGFGGGGFGRPGGPPPDKSFFEAMFDRTDSNSDGKLTKAEVPEERRGMRVIFDRIGSESLDKEQFVRGMLVMAQAASQDRRPGEQGPPGPRAGEGRRAGGPPREGRPGEGRPGEGPPRGPEGRPGMRPGGPPGGGLFAALDTNRDGELSNAEIIGAGSALLKLDRNSDGKITPDEAFGPPGPPPGRDGDRRPGERGPRDGERRPGDRGPGDRGPGDRGPPDVRPNADRGNFSPEAFRDRLKEADSNNDGKLSKEEAPPMLKERFDRADTNSDGFLDDAEMRQMFQRMREGGPRGGGPRDGERARDNDRPRDGDRPRDN